ncbi:MAG: hypothetical protein ACN6OP_23805 [Pseudomonadales bacterium]
MNKDQLLEKSLQALINIKSSSEYCLFNAFDSDFWCMTKAEWSGWAQAIGAVAAILVAISIALYQRCNERRHREDDRLSEEIEEIENEILMLIAIHFSILDAKVGLKNLQDKISGVVKRPPSSSAQRVHSIEQSLQIVLAKKVPVEGIRPILRVCRELAYSKRAIEDAGLLSEKSESSPLAKAAKRRTEKVEAQANIVRRYIVKKQERKRELQLMRYRRNKEVAPALLDQDDHAAD